MDWHYLGHATWLAELDGARVLFDPLLEDLHHGGVFEVDPPREIHAEALRPDFVVVTHAHADHFDLPSLVRLFQLDPETVLFTADELVERAARRIGFGTVATVAPFARIDLGASRLIPTPSESEEPEWGMMVQTREGVVWNQVDSAFASPDALRAVLADASQVTERDVTRGLPLALVRWQPLLELPAAQSGPVGFPLEQYALALACVEATGAAAVVPASAGVRHAAPYAWMNHYVYPVRQPKFLHDLAACLPGTTVFPGRAGATYRVRGGRTTMDPTGARAFVSPGPEPDPATTLFRPYETPALRDENPDGRDEGAMRAAVERWLRDALAPALARAYPGMKARGALSLALELVFPRTTDAYTFRVSPAGVVVECALDPDYDVLNSVAGSMLCDVIEGRRSWHDPTLGGMYRLCARPYALEPGKITVPEVQPAFLMYALSLRESIERAVDWQLGRLLGG